MGRSQRGMRKQEEEEEEGRQGCCFRSISLLLTLQCTLHHRGYSTRGPGPWNPYINQSPATGNRGQEVWSVVSVTPQASFSEHLERGQMCAISTPAAAGLSRRPAGHQWHLDRCLCLPSFRYFLTSCKQHVPRHKHLYLFHFCAPQSTRGRTYQTFH